MKVQTKSKKVNKAWLNDHIHDPYVRLAQKEGFRSRAAYKLKEIDETLGLLKPGQLVVDLGASPGAWSQYVRRKFAPKDAGTGGAAVGELNGTIIALDLLEFDPIEGVTFIQGDFRDDAVLQALTAALDGRQVDLVLSDMAPNMSGIAVVDQARVMHLAELTLEFCALHLKPGGAMLTKVFQGDGFMELRNALQTQFQILQMRKPAASRNRSAEIYLLARGKRG